MSGHEEIRALATRLFDCVERGDVAAVAACYAPDVVIWHNTDGVEQSREENLRTLGWVVRTLVERRYVERRLDVFDGGFVQQHLLTGVRADGGKVSLPAVLVGRVEGGKITRLDEYIDSAHVTQLTGARPD
jgi:ketosteroid isomerase-like protein